MKENHFLDDGAYSAVQIIIETVRRRLAGEGDIAVELLKGLKEPKDASEFRMKITVIYLSSCVSCVSCVSLCNLLSILNEAGNVGNQLGMQAPRAGITAHAAFQLAHYSIPSV